MSLMYRVRRRNLSPQRPLSRPLLSGIDVSIHRLSVLLGEEPGALRSELEKTNPIPSAGPEVDVGLPSDLLKRRPDIRRSEAQLAAATARIGPGGGSGSISSLCTHWDGGPSGRSTP